MPTSRDDDVQTILTARHLARLRRRIRREARQDGRIARLPWGHLARDSEAGRLRIARALARLDRARQDVLR